MQRDPAVFIMALLSVADVQDAHRDGLFDFIALYKALRGAVHAAAPAGEELSYNPTDIPPISVGLLAEGDALKA